MEHQRRWKGYYCALLCTCYVNLYLYTQWTFQHVPLPPEQLQDSKLTTACSEQHVYTT